MLLLAGLAGGGCAQYTLPAATRTGGDETVAVRRPAGYLGNRTPAAKDFLPPPPAPGSAEAVVEIQIFRDTRALAGSPRWEMAAGDAVFNMWPVYSCALGADLKPDDVPLTSRLIQRVSSDIFPIVGQQKNLHNRPRPFTVADGDTCVPPDGLSPNGSYPSGHSTAGWTWALILAGLAPDHAGLIIGRGRAFGESRVVCGVHYPSDVVAGQMIAAAVITALQSNPAFIADRNAAKAELEAALTTAPAPDTARCSAENRLVRQRPW